VRPGSALDREALKRGNSVYFPDRVVPMLPERISNDLCSLREGDRPALAVRMTFAADGRKLRHWLPPHHDEVGGQARLSAGAGGDRRPARRQDGADPRDGAEARSGTAYAVLKRGREARQPLELDLPERKILLKADGTVDRVVVPERLDAHR
jgi:ribonuclease R